MTDKTKSNLVSILLTTLVLAAGWGIWSSVTGYVLLRQQVQRNDALLAVTFQSLVERGVLAINPKTKVLYDPRAIVSAVAPAPAQPAERASDTSPEPEAEEDAPSNEEET